MAKIMCAFAVQLFFVSTALAASASMMQELVPVTVYYEALCPDSRKFFEQLKPVYSNLSSYMNVTLVPFGRSTFNHTDEGKYIFTCHHGEQECYGNKVQACALNMLPSNKQVDFVACVMTVNNNNTNSNSTYPGNFCASLTGVDYTLIEPCVNSDKGNELLAKYGMITNSFQSPLEHVPTVVFHDKYVAEEDEMAKKDFKSALCSKITGTKPAECSSGNGNSAVSFNPGYLPGLIVFTVTILTRF